MVVLFAMSKSIWKGFHAGVARIARPAVATGGVLVIAVGAALSVPEWLGVEALRLVAFQAKALPLVFVVIWIRWTLPRLRIDQMMSLCWKYFVPFAFAAFLFTTLWIAFVPEVVQGATRAALTLFGAFGIFVFVRRAVRTFRATRSVLYANPFV